jgi:hypothetical protein
LKLPFITPAREWLFCRYKNTLYFHSGNNYTGKSFQKKPQSLQTGAKYNPKKPNEIFKKFWAGRIEPAKPETSLQFASLQPLAFPESPRNRVARRRVSVALVSRSPRAASNSATAQNFKKPPTLRQAEFPKTQ